MAGRDNRHVGRGGRSARPTDVLVVGGGPAGIAAAVGLARAGLSVRVLEGSSYQDLRFGEHLSPDCRPLLEGLGLWAPFLDCRPLASSGIRVAWNSTTPYERDYVFSAYGNGWNLDRQRFDGTLATAAAVLGVDVVTATRFTTISGRPGQWRVRLRGGPLDGRHITTRFLVDATGRSTSVARRLGARRERWDRLIGLCLWLAERDDAARDDSRLLVEATESGWCYAVPLPESRLAAVMMTDWDLVPADDREGRAFWDAGIATAEHVSRRVRRYRRRVRFRIGAADSYVLRPAAGAGWLAVGDAAMATDPLSSMGLVEALRSGLASAAMIVHHLSGDQDALAGYSEAVAQRFSGYLSERSAIYALERRWADYPFWRRRHAPLSAGQPQASISAKSRSSVLFSTEPGG